MKYFYPLLHVNHNPSFDYSDGFPPFKYMESVKRLEKLMDGVFKHAKKEDIIYVKNLIKLKYLYEIHDKKYINFLIDLCKELDKNEEYLPSMFRENLEYAPIRFKGGMYCKEIGTPIQKTSIKSMLNSANTALQTALHVHKTNENAFALTRPPGHHSGIRSYGGYGFINNCFIGAKYFLNQKVKPVILDIDYHIGDGSIELCEKFGVQYHSLHIDPWKNYPYLTKNITFKPNIHLTHLQHNTTSKTYMNNLKRILKNINTQKPDVLILSLGFDILQSDYCQDEAILIKSKDFFDIGKSIKKFITCKVMICLEGGYDKPNITKSMDEFLKGFLK